MLFRILFIILSLLPGFAFAGNLFEPVGGDKSMVVLASVFGNLGVFGSSGADPFAAGIAMFNGGVLIIGGVLVSYTILAGTIGTAHDGEMLGKKFSSVWVPIRTALGTALVLPVINGTYCTMQGIVGWLIVQGVGMADNVWSSYTTTQSINMLASAGLASSSAKNLGYNMFKSYVCLNAANKAIALAKQQADTVIPADIVGSVTTDSSDSSQIVKRFGFNNRMGLTPDACGTVEIPTSQSATTESDTLFSYLNPADYIRAFARSNVIAAAQVAATNEMMTSMDTLSQNMVDTLKPVNIAQVDSIIAAYENKLRTSAASQIQQLQQFQTMGENASADGWFLAGAFYTKLAWMADLVQRSMAKTSTASGPNSISNPTLNDAFKGYQDLLTETFKTTGLNNDGSFALGKESGSDESWLKLILKGDVDKIVKKLIFGGLAGAGWAPDDNEHPLMAMKRLGNWLISLGAGATGGGITVMLTAGVAGGGIATAAQTVLILFALPLFAVGATLSYILPMMPFMIFFGAAVGWLVMCVEAIIAAPMWAVMHLTADGHDMVGSGSQGYRLVLSLMLRPVLMIFGLIGSFVMLSVVGQLFNKVFYSALLMSQVDTGIFVMLLGIICVPALYAGGIYMLIKTLFNLIHQIPDELLNWFGGGGPQLGQMSNKMGGDGSHAYVAIGTTANTASKGLTDGASGYRSGMLQKQSRDAEMKTAELTKIKQLDDMDKELGTGASNFLDYASAGGQNEMAGVQAKGAMRDHIGAIGGPKSPAGANFLRKLNESVEAEKTKPEGQRQNWNQLFNSVAQSTLKGSFGSGAGEVLGRVGGGGRVDENGNTIQSFSGVNYSNGLTAYNSMKETMANSGMNDEQINSAFKTMNTEILNSYKNSSDSIKNGGDKSMASFMHDTFAKFNPPNPPNLLNDNDGGDQG